MQLDILQSSGCIELVGRSSPDACQRRPQDSKALLYFPSYPTFVHTLHSESSLLLLRLDVEPTIGDCCPLCQVYAVGRVFHWLCPDTSVPLDSV